MPITSSAKKAHAASVRKRVFNLRRTRAMADAVKTVHKHVAGGKVEDAEKAVPLAYQAIDKAAKRGVIKKNTASRMKARIARVAAKKASK